MRSTTEETLEPRNTQRGFAALSRNQLGSNGACTRNNGVTSAQVPHGWLDAVFGARVNPLRDAQRSPHNVPALKSLCTVTEEGKTC